MTHHSKQRMTALACILILALSLLAGCAAKGGEAITALDQLGEKGRKIGVASDLLEYGTLQQDYPEAEVIAYGDSQLAYEDVANGRLDAYVYARRVMEFAMENGTTGVRLLDENYRKTPSRFCGASASPGGSCSTPTSFPAARSSAWPSPARSRWTRT